MKAIGSLIGHIQKILSRIHLHSSESNMTALMTMEGLGQNGKLIIRKPRTIWPTD